MRGLIDADILVFRAGFAAERNWWYLKVMDADREVPTTKFKYKKEAMDALDEALPAKYSREEGVDYQMWAERECEPVENALYLVNKQMDKIMDDCSLSEFDIVCYLSGPTNFRYDVAKTRPYKGNRDAAHRPTHEEAIRKHIQSKWYTVGTDGIEADDALGIAQTAAGTESTCIISIDKDLDMIPGLHYNFKDEIHYDITKEQGWKIFCKQLLTGDTTDNIPGLPKIGAMKAEKILDGVKHDDLLQAVVTEYASRSGQRDWFAYLQEQAQLIWIRQTGMDILGILAPYEEGGFDDGTDTTSLFY